MNAGRIALALDQILCRPDAAEILSSAHGFTPTHLADQIDAASADVLAGLHRVARVRDMDGPQLLDPIDHPEWVRLGVLSALTTWLTGEGSTCMHSPHPQRPQPITAAAWRPGLIACVRCAHLFVIANATKDATCDGCGRVTAGLTNNDGIRPSIVAMGPLTWLFGVCNECDYSSTEAAA